MAQGVSRSSRNRSMGRSPVVPWIRTSATSRFHRSSSSLRCPISRNRRPARKFLLTYLTRFRPSLSSGPDRVGKTGVDIPNDGQSLRRRCSSPPSRSPAGSPSSSDCRRGSCPSLRQRRQRPPHVRPEESPTARWDRPRQTCVGNIPGS